MKKALVTIALVVASGLTMYGQGRVNFNNLVSGNTITVAGEKNAAGQGAANALLGQDYSVQLLWASGSYSDLASFLTASDMTSSGVFSFYAGSLTGSDGSDGAGYFDAGTLQIGLAGTYTMLVRAWYNGGQYADYNSAYGIANTGESDLFSMAVTAPPAGVNNTIFSSFSVAVVPEPSTFALAGIGAVTMLIFRRRK